MRKWRAVTLLREHLDLTRIEVIVVDNDSADESVQYLREQVDIKLVERQAEPGNVAHARGFDLGLDAVRSKYVLLIHTDTFIHSAGMLDMLT